MGSTIRSIVISGWNGWFLITLSQIIMVNYGPVYFLHCVSPCLQENISHGNSSYDTQPVVRIGMQAISINAGNYVFLPIVTSAAETIDNGVPDNPTTLLNYVRMELEAGDNPPDPDQATCQRSRSILCLE
jgi:hypothetical protein